MFPLASPTAQKLTIGHDTVSKVAPGSATLEGLEAHTGTTVEADTACAGDTGPIDASIAPPINPTTPERLSIKATIIPVNFFEK